MKLNKNKLQRGFTIIEVMIVLAIAGLIMVIVFLAVPNLQRSQRNTTRKSIADRIKTEVDNYASNNDGTYPLASNGCTAAGASEFDTPACSFGFFHRYLGCPGTTPNWCSGNINDPQTGLPVGTTLSGANLAGTAVSFNGAPGGLTATTAGSINYTTGAQCNGESIVATTGGNTRSYALQMALEGGAVYCLDNH